jgi:Serpentine type 7TM GPCR chemoreceptor Srv
LWTGCTVVDYPRGCNQENGECKTELVFWIFGGALLSFVMLSLVVINFVIFWYVRQRNRRVRRNSLSSERQTQRTSEVAVQAFLYVAAFWATFVWIFALKMLDSLSFDALDIRTFYPLMVLHSLFMPSAGLFNLCIYLRPRYLKTRANFPAETRVWAVRRALYGESVPPTGPRMASLPAIHWARSESARCESCFMLPRPYQTLWKTRTIPVLHRRWTHHHRRLVITKKAATSLKVM